MGKVNFLIQVVSNPVPVESPATLKVIKMFWLCPVTLETMLIDEDALNVKFFSFLN